MDDHGEPTSDEAIRRRTQRMLSLVKRTLVEDQCLYQIVKAYADFSKQKWDMRYYDQVHHGILTSEVFRGLADCVGDALINDRYYGHEKQPCIWCSTLVRSGIIMDDSRYALCLGNPECLHYGGLALTAAIKQ